MSKGSLKLLRVSGNCIGALSKLRLSAIRRLLTGTTEMRQNNRNDTSVFSDQLVDVKEITSALNIGATKWWEGVRDGRYPQPVRLGRRTTRWRRSEINELIRIGVSV